MDVDDVFEKIGDFGTTQKKIFFPTNILVHTFVSFHILIISFIGLDPDWSCTDSNENTKESRLLFGSIDTKACKLFESGRCKPQFEEDYTSIVTSVSELSPRLVFCFLMHLLAVFMMFYKI